jgi:hypothetical protein
MTTDGPRGPALDREVLLFASADEFRGRERYQAELTCTKNDLDRIVGKYAFAEKDRLQCGLNRCNTWHQHGYVISTKDGRETHCGQDCGKREFGVTWDHVEAVYKRAEDARARRAALAEFLPRRTAMLGEARLLLSAIEAACTRVASVMALVRQAPGLQSALVAAIRDGGRVRVEVHLDKDQREAMGIRDGKANLQTIATIEGGAAMSAHSRIAATLRSEVIAPLERMTDDSMSGLEEEELRRETKALDLRERSLENAKSFLVEAERFCRSDNLARFSQLKQVMPRKARDGRLDRVLARLPKALDVTPGVRAPVSTLRK